MKPSNRLIIDSSGNIALFYLDNGGQIKYIIWQRKGYTAESRTCPAEMVQEFYLDIDADDNIHMVAITPSKKVLYLRYYHDKWAKHVLYDFSTTAGTSISNVKIISYKDDLHLFYVISVPNGDMALFHHQWSSNQWKGYRVLDSRANHQLLYDINVSSRYLYLTLYDGKDISVWQFSGDSWSKTGNINTRQRPFNTLILQEDYALLGDSQGVFIIKGLYDSTSSKSITIVEDARIDKGPVIINRRKTLYAAWLSDGEVYYRTSYDGGTSWGRVKKYPYISAEKVEEYHFANNYSPLIKAKKVFATDLANLHIPFVHKPGERIKLLQEEHTGKNKGKGHHIQQDAANRNNIKDILERMDKLENMLINRRGGMGNERDILYELQQLRNFIKEEMGNTVDLLVSFKEEINSKIDKEMGALLREIKSIEERLNKNSPENSKNNIIIP